MINWTIQWKDVLMSNKSIMTCLINKAKDKLYDHFTDAEKLLTKFNIHYDKNLKNAYRGKTSQYTEGLHMVNPHSQYTQW